ncbi:MAG TPA: hypothetical protein PLL11_08175, partial [Spirochaetota bacterium]|nr:hypothetical protein [Spirochaetota bacterium]
LLIRKFVTRLFFSREYLWCITATINIYYIDGNACSNVRFVPIKFSKNLSRRLSGAGGTI